MDCDKIDMQTDNEDQLHNVEKNVKACNSCRVGAAKYRCPACLMRSCSLHCVNAHKMATGCTGRKKPVTHMSLKEMDESTLLSDYRFLETVRGAVAAGIRTPQLHHLQQSGQHKMRGGGRHGYRSPNMFGAELPHQLRRLQHMARKRRTHLTFMPRDMTRHANNTSHFSHVHKVVRWLVRVEFLHADIYFEDTFDERSTVAQIVGKFLDSREHCHRSGPLVLPATHLAAVVRGRASTASSSTPSTEVCEASRDTSEQDRQMQMDFYVSAGVSDIAVLLRKESLGSHDKYSLLDPHESLQDSLSDAFIVEHPVLVVVMKDHVYELLGDRETEDPVIKVHYPKTSDTCNLSESMLKFFDADYNSE